MINFINVSKQFFPDSYALQDINFEVNDGELVLITGPSGSGKTTLMRLLIKEYEPTSGEIHFFGDIINKIRNSKIHLHRRKIGVVFQDYKLLNELNVWENIALPLFIMNKNTHEIEKRVTDLLDLISLKDKAHMFPEQLSGGEAQRVSLARALSTGPNVIFADEPTGNLDPKTSLMIISLLKKINELGTTILLASHDQVINDQLNEIRRIELNQGKMTVDTGAKHKIALTPEPTISKELPTKNDNQDNQAIKIEVKNKKEDIKTDKKKKFSIALFKKK